MPTRRGQFRIVLRTLQTPAWRDLWAALDIREETLGHLGLAKDVADDTLWWECQRRETILITGNRNAEGPESLEATIRQENSDRSLPVLTLADPVRISGDRAYAERVAERLLEVIIDLDNLRGSDRIYLP
jgi:hypothetical protein